MTAIIDSDQHLYESRTCWLDHVDPPEQVAFDTDPAEVARLKAAGYGDASIPAVSGYTPPTIVRAAYRLRSCMARTVPTCASTISSQRAGDGSRALESKVHVARQDELDVRVLGLASALAIARLRVAPLATLPAVVEHRLTVEGHLHLAVHAAHHP